MTDSYDELPYSNDAFATTHPVRLATVASLHALTPPDARRCRVLELGCGRGGNLLPMAETLPDSEFVGIDLSQGHIDDALADREALGSDNVRFEVANILDIDRQYGDFDFIIAHGVYSWVPEAVQRKMLSLCETLLTPRGLAYVSYNTLPGWHHRGVVRDMLQYHVNREAPARVQLQQARSFLDFVSKAVPDREGVRSRLLREECDYLLGQTDSYLFHEHLETNNRPCYFHEFASQLAAYRLQYVGESEVDPLRACLPPGADEALRKVCPDDRVRYEQHLDFLTYRTFRRSLLCRSGAEVRETMTDEPLSRCWFTSDAAPVDTSLTIPSKEPVVFRTADNVELATEHPLVQAILHELHRAAPRWIHFEELSTAVAAQVGGGANDREFQSELRSMLLAGYRQSTVDLNLFAPPLTAEVSVYPQVSACARLQAERNPSVTNRAHRSVELDPLGRYLMCQLDGSRSHTDLEQLLVDQVSSGGMTIETQDGVPLNSDSVADHCRNLVASSLAKFAACGFLIA